MLVFGRQIRSRLDLLLPKNETSSKADITVRQFLDGDRVRMRDFLSKDKWKFGRIAVKLGKLRYAVRLDDGRIWERHIDHVVGVGADLRGDLVNTPGEEEFIERYEATTSAAVAVTPDATGPVEEATGMEPVDPCHDAATTLTPAPGPDRSLATEANRAGVSESVPPLRRSNRVTKPPQRLNL